jgi:putative acetyltransferase
MRVRGIKPGEERSFLDVHHAAVRGLAGSYYSPAIVNDWATLPVTDEAVDGFKGNPDREVRLVAEADSVIIGVGALIVRTAELRACYVLPSASRQGVGTAIVREIERIARQEGPAHLELDASLNSEPFYLALGFQALNRGEHLRRSGLVMPARRRR